VDNSAVSGKSGAAKRRAITSPGTPSPYPTVSTPGTRWTRTHAYYQGPGWYRTSFAARNPFPNGRTLLHFEGAGQKSEVFVGLESVGQHVGGYDEFTLDITLAAARAARRPDAKGQVQELLAIKG
jgi:beta-galactosidase/beta-glucuronidase